MNNPLIVHRTSRDEKEKFTKIIFCAEFLKKEINLKFVPKEKLSSELVLHVFI